MKLGLVHLIEIIVYLYADGRKYIGPITIGLIPFICVSVQMLSLLDELRLSS